MLCFVFFVSGAAALIFETLWFRLASLAFGSSVWASSCVLSSFMAGLALGNALAGAASRRIARPARAYALLELAVAASGVSLVLLFPVLQAGLAPIFEPLLDRPVPLNAVRFGFSFALMSIPATAMGASLPLLVKALSSRDANFGSVLGRLYGWNTLGGVAGAVVAEVLLIGAFGIRGAGYVAGGLNLIAAGVALLVAGRESHARVAEPAVVRVGASPRARRLLFAAAACGATLLALEVVWFRFLQLFVTGTSLAFALMLAVVLAGIGAGGLAAARVLVRWPDGHRLLPVVAWAGAFSVGFGYVDFDRVLALVGTRDTPAGVLLLAGWLAFPTSVWSGVLFTFIGRALKDQHPDETRATAALTLSNTLGGMLGAGMGGLALLPALGMERATFLLAVAYLLVGGLCLAPSPDRKEKRALVAAGGCAALYLLLFPFGIMTSRYLQRVRSQWDLNGAMTLVALREGRSETIQYLRQDLLGQPYAHRLITNNYSMSGTSLYGRRYMSLFAYLGLALQPEAKRALLISYGVGITAKALTEARQLQHIDVVDSSADILELASVPFPPPQRSPLQDPRVEVHVEDGRFFLRTSRRSFDLITGEPPPPNAAGVVNLYTREHFDLMREHLAAQGVATYWLPVYQIPPRGARSAIRAFCGAFPDCTLWTGASLEWILVGTRGLPQPIPEPAMTAQWRVAGGSEQLRAVGLELPEQLGATFLADSEQLRDFVEQEPALVDDFPQRLTPSRGQFTASPEYARWMDPEAARSRFAASRFIGTVWPAGLRERTLAYFRWQRLANDYFGVLLGLVAPYDPEDLRAVLAETELRALPLWLLQLSHQELAIWDAASAPLRMLPDDALARRALAERRFAEAERLFALLLAAHPNRPRWVELHDVSAALAGRPESARGAK